MHALTETRILVSKHKQCLKVRADLGFEHATDTWTDSGSARTLFEGVCPLQYRDSNIGENYVRKVTVAYSNDGILYSAPYQFVVYDSKCQTIGNTALKVWMSKRKTGIRPAN